MPRETDCLIGNNFIQGIFAFQERECTFERFGRFCQKCGKHAVLFSVGTIVSISSLAFKNTILLCTRLDSFIYFSRPFHPRRSMKYSAAFIIAQCSPAVAKFSQVLSSIIIEYVPAEYSSKSVFVVRKQFKLRLFSLSQRLILNSISVNIKSERHFDCKIRNCS